MKKIVFLKPAEKYLDKQPVKMIGRVVSAIYQLPKGDVKPLSGTNGEFRLRVGEMRVLFTMENGTIIVQNIDNRGDVYKA